MKSTMREKRVGTKEIQKLINKKENIMIITAMVTSSNIKSLAYDDSKMELHVTFNNGGRYVYLGVPKKDFDTLRSADSVGKEFNLWKKNFEGITINTGLFNFSKLIEDLSNEVPHEKIMDNLGIV